MPPGIARTNRTNDSQTTTALLPAELVEQICDSLEAVDISSLRLVCIQLFEKTTRAFFITSFSTVTTDFCTKSLRRIEEISQHPQARQAVKELVVAGANDVGGMDPDLGHDIEGQWHRSIRGNLEAPLPDIVNRFLREVIVEGLPNCRSFRIRAISGPQYFPANLNGPSTAYLRLTDVVELLLSHFSEFRLPVKAFTLDISSSGTCQDMRPLRPDTYRNPNFVEVWSNHLQELDLVIWGWWDLTQEVKNFITALIGSATNLKTLSLDSSSTDSLLDHISASQPSWKPQLHHLNLHYVSFDSDSFFRSWRPPLRHLSLYSVHGDRHLFFNFLSIFRETLRTLSLKHVRLEIDSFQDFLSALAHCFTHLETVCLFVICVRFPGFNHLRFVNYWWDRAKDFPPGVRWIQQGSRPLIGGIHYEGPDVVGVLESLVKVAYVRKIRGVGVEPLEIPVMSPAAEPCRNAWVLYPTISSYAFGRAI
ncbi:uncharacterized protein K452DRAFT_114217 [Aplosporella prunicola CBS 121167]|uniref:F-box domain-containing protein n=1 Tax=Aplosporella prunicola CBS 121167 TaxID=1176127 RepID=A0A6A6B0Y7_9PEZI|nr:uncharacterized protein K452DRAFT_114217 [Aplosporella prunicola CBS 121167]KAF2137093.1 hypothetical protein K452DRAFT_114217 [Aplosporella prunicola CBS 121167]